LDEGEIDPSMANSWYLWCGRVGDVEERRTVGEFFFSWMSESSKVLPL
jgi:hypothetical protein